MRALARKLFPQVTQFRFEEHVLVNMRELCWQTHPKEVIALLQGRREGGTLVVHALIFQPFENTSYSATIHLDPTLTDIVGTFHSHPGATAEPSDEDLSLFAQHAGLHVIVPEPYRVGVVHNSAGEVIGRVPLTNGRGVSRGEWRGRRGSR